MKKRARLVTAILFLGLCFGPLAMTSASPAQDQEKTTEQVFKNIQVLKGLPASQLQPIMAILTASLGVRCNHCHTNQFDKDDRPAKQAARRMMRMVLDLNKETFSGKDAVNCYTCHRGQPKPVAVTPVGTNLWQRPGAAGAKPDAALPALEHLLDRYEQAVGGKAALMKITTRVMKGSRIGADGVLVPEEVYQSASNKLLVVTSYRDAVFRKGFDGARGWARSSQGESPISKEELAELERDAEFYGEIKLRELYPQMSVEGKTVIGDREAFTVAAVGRRGLGERLYFDAETGLLLRRYREFKTPLGLFPMQTDYEDYKEVDGVRLPVLIRWSMPGRSWGRKITEVKHNTGIDDSIFSPAGGKG
ncbi:MAG TPA: c-type cytochrome [Blastocatellia bacterium]|nr:c-type cytochrome [Blastocatellia bacterium]